MIDAPGSSANVTRDKGVQVPVVGRLVQHYKYDKTMSTYSISFSLKTIIAFDRDP